MSEDKQKLLEILYAIIAKHPDGIQEYDLLEILREKGLPCFSKRDATDSLGLFRTHFLLFHLLYLLRDHLRKEKKNDLVIHCLRIGITPWISADTTLPAKRDGLREYYMDMETFARTTCEEIDGMIEEFWQRYAAFNKRDEALEILGLPESATPGEIKKRYREMALRHHPDHGGDSRSFQRISDAAAILSRS